MAYLESANILEKIDQKKGSVKSLCLTSNYKNKKQLFALVCESLKYKNIVTEIIDNIKLLTIEKCLRNKKSLAVVLVYDFLIGKGLRGAGKLKDAITRHKAALRAELARQKVKRKAVTSQDLIRDHTAVQLPRYVRVNTLKTSVEAVCEHFRERGYALVEPDNEQSYEGFVSCVSRLTRRQFLVDIHIPQLLVFAPGTDLHDDDLYTRGHIILQDKASCVPALVLAPPRGTHVIDCCAAPGNKTSHVAAILQNTGRVFAFDKDGRRLATMRELLRKADVTCAQLTHQDFLTVDPADPQFREVEYAIVDPSCSGSGIASRLNHVTDDPESASDDRLRSLAEFQVRVLSAALSLPAMRRVVYSTCSVHRQENEDVVAAALARFGHRYRLVAAIPSCPSRGFPVFPQSSCCLRLSPETDRTNGFFVVCFQKIDEEINNVVENNTQCELAKKEVNCRDINVNTKSEKNKKKKRKSGQAENASLGDQENEKVQLKCQQNVTESLKKDSSSLHCQIGNSDDSCSRTPALTKTSVKRKSANTEDSQQGRKRKLDGSNSQVGLKSGDSADNCGSLKVKSPSCGSKSKKKKKKTKKSKPITL